MLCQKATNDSSKWTRRDPRTGFTLLETMLAVALSTILIALIGAGMRIYTRTVSDKRVAVVNARVARVIMQRIANDLRSAYTVEDDEDGGGLSSDLGTGDLSGTDSVGTGTDLDTGSLDSTDSSSDLSVDLTTDLTNATVQPTPGIYGNAFELQIDVLGKFAEPVRYDMLVQASGDPLASNLLSEPKVVTYYTRLASSTELAGTPLESSASNDRESMTILGRRVQSRAVAVGTTANGIADTQSGEQMLSDQVVSIQFQYHDGTDWSETWDSSTLGLPIAVQITLTIADPSDENYDNIVVDSTNTYQMTVRIPTSEAPTTATVSEL